MSLHPAGAESDNTSQAKGSRRLHMKAVLDKLDFTLAEKVTAPLRGGPDRIEDLLALPALRQIAGRVRKDGTYWVLHFWRGSQDNMPKNGDPRITKMTLTDGLSKAEAEAIRPDVEKILSRIPTATMNVVGLLGDVAATVAASHFPSRLITLLPLAYKKSKGSNSPACILGIYAIHWREGGNDPINIHVKPALISVARAKIYNASSAGDHSRYQFRAAGETKTRNGVLMGTPSNQPPPGSSPDEIEQHHAAINFLYAVDYQRHTRLFQNKSAFGAYLENEFGRLLGARQGKR